MSRAGAARELLKRAKSGVDTLAGSFVAASAVAQSQDAEASFLGQAAKGADKVMLGMAQKMEDAGINPSEIWNKTGWGKGADSL
jgi:hypothetical protein